MDLGELDAFLDGTFDFTIGGRHFSVAPVAWPVYLELLAVQEHAAAVAEGRAKAEDGPQDEPIYKMAPTVLGPVLDELIAAGVAPPKIIVIARAAYLFQIGEHEVAKAVLQSGGKVASQSESESTSTTPTGSTGTASESTTRRPASTRVTPSQKKSSKLSEPEAQPSTV